MEKLYFQDGIIREKIFINDDSSVVFYRYYYNDDIKKYISSYSYSFKTENKKKLIERYKARGFGSYREIKEKMNYEKLDMINKDEVIYDKKLYGVYTH